jgi:uncharacterized protein YodC (DUF2158 family)
MFELGSIVKLKSGGPQMTVTELPYSKSDTTVECQWFSVSNDQECCSETFEIQSLELVKEK